MIGKTIFTCVYIGKFFKKSSFQEVLHQTSFNLHISFLTKCRIKFLKIIFPGGLGGATIGKSFFMCVYMGEIFKNLQEPLFQKSSYQLESLLGSAE
jgi:hypothetical protein